MQESEIEIRDQGLPIPPFSGGVFRLSHLGVIAGYPMQMVM